MYKYKSLTRLRFQPITFEHYTWKKITTNISTYTYKNILRKYEPNKTSCLDLISKKVCIYKYIKQICNVYIRTNKLICDQIYIEYLSINQVFLNAVLVLTLKYICPLFSQFYFLQSIK